MTMYTTGGGNRGNSVGPLGAMIMMALFFVLLYFIAKGVFAILSMAAPLLIIATLFLDHTVVTDYLKMVWGKLRTNVGLGIILLLLTLFGFPIVSGYLFFKAYMKRQLNQHMEEVEQKKYADYEVVDEEVEEDDFLELPELEIPKQSKRSSSEYDNMFD